MYQNKITASMIYSKLQDLIPKLPNSVTPELLNTLCEDDSVQPFLQWFIKNINHDNILSDADNKMQMHIKKNFNWETGKNLDISLNKATEEYPELLKLLQSDYWNSNQSLSDYTTEKELYDPDFECYQSLEDSLQNLKDIEEQLDIEISNENDALKKEKIKLKITKNNCTSANDEIDTLYRQFFTDLELLSHTYIDALQNKGEPCLWSQMPIENFIKQIETYTDYLSSYAKRQFSNNLEKDELKNNEDNLNFSSNCNENEYISELMTFQKSFFSSKMNKIMDEVEEIACRNMANHAIEIYNNGKIKIPSSSVLARTEIVEMTKRRDFLEENIRLLQEKQMVNAVQEFSKSKIIKILEEEGEIRLLRRKNKLEKLERLLSLAKENGYAYSHLLCMLIELQTHQINEIVQFVFDAHHYLNMEYNLSSTRTETMQKLKNEYELIASSQKEKNIFNRIFLDLIGTDDPKDDFRNLKHSYDELTLDNENKLKVLFEEKVQEKIKASEKLESKVMMLYNGEISDSPTHSLKSISCDMIDLMDKSKKQVNQLEDNIEVIRKKLKTMMKETSCPSYKREKLLLWQRFLADPEYLKQRLKEMEDLVDRSEFCQHK